MPHSSGTPERVLRAGETLVVDLFPRGGLFADCTRTFCVGEPPPRVAAAFAAVREALQLAHAAARPGARGWDLQVAVCEAFTARGYATPLSEPGTLQGYVHGLGHGVGFELHEYPSFKRHAEGDGLLEVGDVLTLEPGLYDPDPVTGFGIRLEDLVHLGERTARTSPRCPTTWIRRPGSEPDPAASGVGFPAGGSRPMQDYEKLGVFYLGRPVDPASGRGPRRAAALRLAGPRDPRRLRRA